MQYDTYKLALKRVIFGYLWSLRLINIVQRVTLVRRLRHHEGPVQWTHARLWCQETWSRAVLLGVSR